MVILLKSTIAKNKNSYFWQRNITVDGIRRSDEALQEGGRRRLQYIHEKMKIYSDVPIHQS